MLVRLVNLCGALLCIAGFVQLSEAQCKKPKDNDIPHGANEFILLSQKVGGRIYGKVFFPNYLIEASREPAKDIVLEIYNYSGGDSYDDVIQVLREQKRIAACLTRANGKFSFTDLKSGKYLLRAGTRERNQFNEVHIIITLEYRNKRSRVKGLEIILPAGT